MRSNASSKSLLRDNSRATSSSASSGRTAVPTAVWRPQPPMRSPLITATASARAAGTGRSIALPSSAPAAIGPLCRRMLFIRRPQAVNVITLSYESRPHGAGSNSIPARSALELLYSQLTPRTGTPTTSHGRAASHEHCHEASCGLDHRCSVRLAGWRRRLRKNSSSFSLSPRSCWRSLK